MRGSTGFTRNVHLIIVLGLVILIFAPTGNGQGCTITDQGQSITIYTSLSDDAEVIGTFQISNAIELVTVSNEDMTLDYFGAELLVDSDTLIIHKTDEFPKYLENESETIVTVRVTFRCTIGTTIGQTIFIFYIYLESSNDNSPTFPLSEYNMVIPLPLPKDFELTFYGAIYARDIDLGDNRVTFSGGNNYFTVGTIGRSTSNPKEYYMSLKTARQILVLPAEATTMQITATDLEGLTGQATVQIAIDPENSYSRDPSPTFEKQSYTFRIDEGGNYYNEFCSVTEESFEASEIVFSLEGQDKEFFTMSFGTAEEEDEHRVSVIFNRVYDEADFPDRTYLTVDLLATRQGYDTGHATIIVDLPVDCSPQETTTPSSCEITNCPDTDGPVFTKKLYTYRVFEGTLGVVGTVEAEIDDANLKDTLRYRLNYNEEAWLSGVVVIDEITGTVSLVEEKLTESTFNIEVIATVEDEETTKVGTARIIVAFDENEKCSEVPVEKTLTFLTLREEQKHTDIFPLTVGECEYELLSFVPNDKEYVFVDENQKLSTIEIDRESESFGAMTTPQIQVKLKLVCPTPTDPEALLLLRKRRAIDNFMDNVFTDEITFNSDITTLNVFIEDINDNAPVFEYPAMGITEIGYPDAELVGLLLPPYLIKVVASDADENAQIEYSLDSNSNFGIDSKSGVIFPLTSEVGSDVLMLYVSAADGAHITTTQLRVHKLTLDHLIVIYVENFGSHETEEVAKHLESELGQTLHILKYANVPVNYVKRSSLTRTTAGTNLKFIVYAFDADKQLVKASDLLQKLEDIEGTSSYSLSSVKLEDDISLLKEVEANSSTFVAVIITLGVLVLILLGAGFVGWWFWIRPTEWKHIEETNSVENVPVPEMSEKTTEDILDRPSLVLNGHTWTESNDTTVSQMNNRDGSSSNC